MTKIYLVTNCYNNPNMVYIGKTTSSRKTKHTYTYGDNIIYTEIDSINSNNKRDWKPLETYWIQQFKVWGFDVLNKNNGGGGPSYQTEEAIQKMRKPKLNKKNFSYPKTKSFIESVTGKSKVHPKSRNNNISKSLLGYKQTQEHVLKRTLNLKGKPNIKNQKPKPDGFGELISKVLTGRKRDNICKSINQYHLNGDYIRTFKSITEACDILFNDRSRNANITGCCKGKTKSAYGFIFKYA